MEIRVGAHLALQSEYMTVRLSNAGRLFMIAVAVAGIAAAAIRSATASTPAPPPPGTGSTASGILPSPAPGYWTPERMRNAKPA